jgi:hypothetical protein
MTLPGGCCHVATMRLYLEAAGESLRNRHSNRMLISNLHMCQRNLKLQPLQQHLLLGYRSTTELRQQDSVLRNVRIRPIGFCMLVVRNRRKLWELSACILQTCCSGTVNSGAGKTCCGTKAYNPASEVSRLVLLLHGQHGGEANCACRFVVVTLSTRAEARYGAGK